MKMPTDEVVKDAATFRSNRLGEPLGVKPEAYDRWLNLVKADAWDHAIEHVSQLEADVGFMEHYKPHNPYRKQEEA